MVRIGLFLAFLVVPVLEIWFLIQVGSVIGGWETVALLIADSMLGAWLMRREEAGGRGRRCARPSSRDACPTRSSPTAR